MNPNLYVLSYLYNIDVMSVFVNIYVLKIVNFPVKRPLIKAFNTLQTKTA